MVNHLRLICAVFIRNEHQIACPLAVADNPYRLAAERAGPGRVQHLKFFGVLPDLFILTGGILFADIQLVAVEGADAAEFRLAVAVKVAQNSVADGLIIQLTDLPAGLLVFRRNELEHALVARHNAGLDAMVKIHAVAVVMSHAVLEQRQGQLVRLVKAVEIVRKQSGKGFARLCPVILIIMAALEAADKQIGFAVSL